MKHILHKITVLALLLVLAAQMIPPAPVHAQSPINFSETTDLSYDYGTSFTVDEGTNTWTGSLEWTPSPGGTDTWMVVVPAYHRITHITYSRGANPNLVTFTFNACSGSTPSTTGASLSQDVSFSSGSYCVSILANFNDTVTSWTVQLTVVDETPVMNPPVITVPGPQTMYENTTLDFGSSVSVADPDAGELPLVTLTAGTGTLTLGDPTVVSFDFGDGTDDTTMSFWGTVAEVNAALNGLTYTPPLNYTGTTSVTVVAEDLTSLTDTDTVNITVNPGNDPPVNTVPVGATVNEDASLTLSGASAISIADADAGGAVVQVALTATNGVMSLSGVVGLDFACAGCSGDGVGDAAMTFQGTMAAINTALDGLVFTPTANYSGPASIQIVTNDLGNTGGGGPQTDTDTAAITVNPMPDPPVNTVPGPQTINEDTPLNFGGGFSVTDPDGGSLTETLTATNGTLTLSGTGGLTFTTGDGTADATMTFSGALADLNTALNGLVFTPTANYSGPASVEITSDDGTTTPDTDTVAITVDPVNDPPVNTVPVGSTVNEDASLTLSGASAISIADVDAGGATVQVALTGTNGVMSLSGTAGLDFACAGCSGDGTTDATMTFQGTIANINTALDGLVFTPTANYSGPASIQIVTNDLGNTGGGGPQTDTDTAAITVNPLPDPPVNTVPGPQTINEDTPLNFGGGFSVADIDGGSLTVTLTATNGTLTLSGTGGLTFTTGDGTADATMTFSGALADLNTALNGLVFTPTANYSGPASVQITSDDGTTTPDTDTVVITVNPLPDSPVNTVPGPQTINEDTSLNFGGGFSVADIDSASLTVTLTATNGTLTLSGTGGLTFTTGDGTADATMTFSGTLADLNTALNGLVFTPPANYNGPASVQITSDDGVTTPDTDTVAITVDPLPDPPVNTVPGPQTINEDTPLNFGGGFSVADPDGGSLTITLTATSGTLTLGGTTGLSFTTGTGSGDTTMTFSGALADLNTALNGLVFTPTANYSGPASVQITSDDGATTPDTDTVAITVNPVADSPVNTVPGPQTINEDTPLNFGGGFSVADPDSASLTITLTATNGVLTLGGTAGLAFTTGDGIDDTTMTFSGTLADLNTALNGLVFTPPANYSGPASVQITSDDGATTPDTDTVVITVDPVGDSPVNTVPGPQTINEDMLLNFGGGFSVADIDSASLTITLTATNGALTLSGTTGLSFTTGDGTGDTTMTFSGALADINAALNGLVFTPAADFSGPATVQITSDDGGTTPDTDAVAITVNPVNDPPETDPDAYSTPEDTPLTVNAALGVLANDTDVEGSGLTATLVADPANGTVTLNADGSFTYTPNLDFEGTDTFTYTAFDGTDSSAPPETVTITVGPVNDAPVAVDDAYATTINQTLTVAAPGVLANDTDVDAGATLTAAEVAAPTHGTLTLNPDGSFTYTPNANFLGTDTFTYQANDGLDNSNVATVTITVSTIVIDGSSPATTSSTTAPTGPVVDILPTVPLCRDLFGKTNSIVRAAAPPDVFCRVLIEQGKVVTSVAEVGNLGLLTGKTLVQAVDVFRMTGTNTYPTFVSPLMVCLLGQGQFWYLDGRTSPRALGELPVTLEGSYTCASVPAPGTVVLVPGTPSQVSSTQAESGVDLSAAIPLANCQVVTQYLLNLRSQPVIGDNVLGQIPYDARLYAAQRLGNWFQVNYYGTVGWLSGEFLDTQGACGQ